MLAYGIATVASYDTVVTANTDDKPTKDDAHRPYHTADCRTAALLEDFLDRLGNEEHANFIPGTAFAVIEGAADRREADLLLAGMSNITIICAGAMYEELRDAREDYFALRAQHPDVPVYILPTRWEANRFNRADSEKELRRVLRIGEADGVPYEAILPPIKDVYATKKLVADDYAGGLHRNVVKMSKELANLVLDLLEAHTGGPEAVAEFHCKRLAERDPLEYPIGFDVPEDAGANGNTGK
jgi:hypothetical protein